MHELEVIDDPAVAAAALDPVRARILAALATPGSAATVATALGMPRQKVHYYLRALEAHGLVTLAEERRWGGLTERVLTATASSYVVSPQALGSAASEPARMTDRLSARYVVAVAARVVREVAALLVTADRHGQRVPTLTIDAEIRFRSAAERHRFTRELSTSVADLIGRYHAGGAPEGRTHRLLVLAHPRPQAVTVTGTEPETGPDPASDSDSDSAREGQA